MHCTKKFYILSQWSNQQKYFQPHAESIDAQGRVLPSQAQAQAQRSALASQSHMTIQQRQHQQTHQHQSLGIVADLQQFAPLSPPPPHVQA